MALTVELVAADRKVWEGEASQVSARSIDGDLGILPGHTPILCVLAEGEVRVNTDGAWRIGGQSTAASSRSTTTG